MKFLDKSLTKKNSKKIISDFLGEKLNNENFDTTSSSNAVNKYYDLAVNGKVLETTVVKHISSKNLQPLLEVKNITKDFKNGKHVKHVLKDISFNINDGEHLAILGGNGAGKTTLVETIMGLNKPTSGEIKYSYKWNKSYLEKLGIQFQASSYPPGITSKEVLMFMIGIYGCKISKEELKKMIKIFGIDEFFEEKAASLSGGQLQRLNCLLAILHKPKIIFLDEVSTGLDFVVKNNIKNFIKEYVEENKMTLVLISHDVPEINFLTNRIVILLEGKIIADAYIKDLEKQKIDLEEFIARYI